MQTQVQEAEKPSQLKRDLGPWSLVGLGVRGIIGSGIFGLIGVWHQGENKPYEAAAVLDFVLGRSK